MKNLKCRPSHLLEMLDQEGIETMIVKLFVVRITQNSPLNKRLASEVEHEDRAAEGEDLRFFSREILTLHEVVNFGCTVILGADFLVVPFTERLRVTKVTNLNKAQAI